MRFKEAIRDEVDAVRVAIRQIASERLLKLGYSDFITISGRNANAKAAPTRANAATRRVRFRVPSSSTDMPIPPSAAIAKFATRMSREFFKAPITGSRDTRPYTGSTP